MTYITVLSAFGGGILIGLAAAVLLFFNNRVAGISGIAAGILPPWQDETGWRLWFLIGLVFSAALWRLFGGSIEVQIDTPLVVLGSPCELEKQKTSICQDFGPMQSMDLLI